MGIGYVLTSTPVEVSDARAVITFTVGPWAQLIAYKEGDLAGLRTRLDSVREQSGFLNSHLIYAYPTLPIPVPKITIPPVDGLVAIVLARLSPGSSRSFADNLDTSLIDGATRLLTPYSHMLLDFSDTSEDSLLRRIDEALDSPEVVRVQIGLALAGDVVYLDT